MSDFYQKWSMLAKARSPICLGIDPSKELLLQWGLPLTHHGIRQFSDILLDAVGELISVFKPQSAFFEQFGSKGISELEYLISRIHDAGALALIDCKRGDIGSTVEAYAACFFGTSSPFNADAITVTPYLGLDALRPIFDQAAAANAMVFVVVRSSNIEGRVLQGATLPNGQSVANALAEQITTLNKTYTKIGIGPIGAVIGATLNNDINQTLDLLPQSLFLAPGIGAQGASLVDIQANFGLAAQRTIPSISRAILSVGPNPQALRHATLEYINQTWKI